MRAFIALELPDELREDVVALQRRLGRLVEGHFVDERSLHVTLAFLGEIGEAEAATAIGAMDAAAGGAGVAILEPCGLGCFGRGATRTLYLELARDAGLVVLAKDLRDQLRRRSLAFDEKGFLPHVTLARRARLGGDALGDLPFPLPAQALRLVLYRSTLTSEGPVYKELYAVEL